MFSNKYFLIFSRGTRSRTRESKEYGIRVGGDNERVSRILERYLFSELKKRNITKTQAHTNIFILFYVFCLDNLKKRKRNNTLYF